MRLSQTLALKVSELRNRANASILALNENADDTKAVELTDAMKTATGELTAVEARHAAAVEAEAAVDRAEGEQFAAPASDPESRERAGLVERANLGAIFAAAVENRHTAGAEAEVQSAFGIGSNQVPLDMLRLPIESRDVTPSPAEVGQSQAAIVPPIFARGDAAFLGVRMPNVGTGSAAFPVLTSRPAIGGPHADSTEVAETTGAFTAESLDPERLQASFFWRRVDAAKFRGMADALRSALSEGLSEAMDAQVIAQIVTDVGRTDAAAAVDSFATYRSRLVYGRLDGRYASTEAAIRILAGAPTVAHMAGQYRGNSADDSAIDSVRRIAGGVRVSAHIAAVNGNRQDVIVRRGNRMDAVAPIWEGVSLIRDELTKAGTGEIVVTAVMLANFKVIRTDGFARMQVRHAV